LHDDVTATIDWADIIVLTTSDPRFVAALKATRPEQTVLELSEVELPNEVRAKVSGFHW